jgi:hypothetical protein
MTQSRRRDNRPPCSRRAEGPPFRDVSAPNDRRRCRTRPHGSLRALRGARGGRSPDTTVAAATAVPEELMSGLAQHAARVEQWSSGPRPRRPRTRATVPVPRPSCLLARALRRAARRHGRLPREEGRARAYQAARDVSRRVPRASGGDGSPAALPTPSPARGACAAPPMASARSAAPTPIACRMHEVLVEGEGGEGRARHRAARAVGAE